MKIAYVVATPELKPGERVTALQGDLRESFRKLKERGYDGAELMVGDPQRVDRPLLRRLSQEFHLEIPVLCTGEIYGQVKQKLCDIGAERVDYLSFVPDGEPSLDIRLGRHIELLKPLGIRIAVITNASLLLMDDVKNDLQKADWVSVKMDAADPGVWKRIDRPHGSISLDKVLQGTIDFAKRFENRKSVV